MNTADVCLISPINEGGDSGGLLFRHPLFFFRQISYEAKDIWWLAHDLFYRKTTFWATHSIAELCRQTRAVIVSRMKKGSLGAKIKVSRAARALYLALSSVVRHEACDEFGWVGPVLIEHLLQFLEHPFPGGKPVPV